MAIPPKPPVLQLPIRGSLPPSFTGSGFVTPSEVVRMRRLMIGADGPTDSGKTEFAMSAPGPGMHLCLDRNIDGVLNNPTPPRARQPNFGFAIVKVPLATQLGTKEAYLEYWRTFYKLYTTALDNKDCRTVVIDGDSDSWELQRLAEFGKLTQIPSIMYTGVNAARRAMYARAYDSGKIIIATNKIKREYEDKFNADGTPALDNSGKQLREWKGQMSRQGFNDQDYLWNIQIRHHFNEVDRVWGITITRCKSNKNLEGMVLEGEDCNFAGLVQSVYPDVPLKEWGF